MNGANPLPPITTSRPANRSTMMIGVSHQRLLWRRKSQSSRTKPRCPRAAWRSNSVGVFTWLVLAEVTRRRAVGVAPVPVAVGSRAFRPLHRVVSANAKHKTDRSQYAEI